MEKDETSRRRLAIEGGGTQQGICLGPRLNFSWGWYLEKQSRYPVRHGNQLTPYYSGEEVFGAIAHSIKHAKKSVDMVMWGFDPALPMTRATHYDHDHEVTRERWILPDKTLRYSQWRQSDALGQILLDALANNPDLKVRMVIWHHPFSLMLMQNVVGMGYAFAESDCPRNEVSTGFNPRRLREPNAIFDDPHLSDLPLRPRHPEAALYSSQWFTKVRWESFPGRDRLAVVFRDFEGIEALNRALSDERVLASVDKARRMYELYTQISHALPTLNRDKILPLIGKSPADIGRAIDQAIDTLKKWLDISEWLGINDIERRLKREYLRRAEEYLNTLNAALSTEARSRVELGIQEEGLDRLDMGLYRSAGSRVTLASPTDHQKTLLIDYEDDANRHGYLMGHNLLTKYWSRFPFQHRDRRNEMDYTPLHDFSLRVEGPLLIDINHNFCEAWERNRTRGLSEVSENEILAPKRATKTPAPSALEKEPPAALRLLREPLAVHIVRQRPKGNASGQIVRTRSDQQFDDGTQEKEIKDAYLHAVRNANNYILIVNQYCQYAKLARHLKHWRRQCRNDGLNGPLYVLIGTCKPEQDGQVFAAQQMANELGVGIQFEAGHDQLYDKTTADAQGRREKTLEGLGAGAENHVIPQDLAALDIKVLFFTFHTQIPVNPRMDGKKPLREDVTAQQPYVHGKLMLLDDVFLTLGSANLNIRSMAVDSEINLISDDYTTAQAMRHKLFGAYSGMETSARFPNRIYDLDRGIPMEAVQDDMKMVFSRLSELAKVNAENVKEGKRIQGCISSFEDDRSALTMQVG